MPYQPTQPHPYLESIDAKEAIGGNCFSVIINPRDIISKYDFAIFKQEVNSETKATEFVLIYSIENAIPDGGTLYGTEDGTPLRIDVPNDECNMENGNDYYWQITLYDSAEKSIKSPFYYFSTKAAPEITFDVPYTINTCEYEFKASFKQDQGESYLCYKYSLYRDGVLIDETEDKIDSQISYTYSGFIANNKYKIKLTVITQDKNIYEREKEFSVSYDDQPPLLDVDVSQLPDKNCVKIDYSKNLFIKGNTDNAISYSTYNEKAILNIPENGSVYYDKINDTTPLPIDEEFTVYYSVHFPKNFAGKIICLTDEVTGNTYSVGYNQNNNKLDANNSLSFYYKINDGDWRYIDPYRDVNYIPVRESVVASVGTTLDDINYEALYLLNNTDEINSDSVIIYNDIAYNFWWTFVLLPDKLLVYKGEKYIETEGGVN